MNEVSLLSAIKHNPTFILLAILVGTPSFVVSVIALIAKIKQSASARWLGIVACIGALLTASAGLLGWLLARAQVDEVLTFPALNDSEKAMLLTSGYAEAAYVLWSGLTIAALPLVLGAVAAMGAKGR